jgi:predicted small metal-binding protein
MHCPDDNRNELRRWAMEKKLSCRAMGLNCAFVARDESEKEIVRKLADHLKTVHAIELTEELGKKANDLIRLVEA